MKVESNAENSCGSFTLNLHFVRACWYTGSDSHFKIYLYVEKS